MVVMVPTPFNRCLLALSRLLCRYDLPRRSTNDSLNADAHGIIPHLPGHAVSGQLLQERVRVELLGRHDPSALPDPSRDQSRGNDRRDTCLIGSGLHPELTIARLVVAHIIDEVRLWLAVLVPSSQGADAGFALESAGQITGLGKQ